ncbi:hypothetical protein C2G38_2047481, partial [Gigaspora rosea]
MDRTLGKLKYLDVGYTRITDKELKVQQFALMGITKEIFNEQTNQKHNYRHSFCITLTNIKCPPLRFRQLDPEQLRTLGYNYQHGIGVEKDEKKAFEYYIKAAELGNSDAMNDLFLCYYYGIGVERNYQKSFEYCKRSADLGNAHGMCSVGNCYMYGYGVDQDYNKAFEYYKKSANMSVDAAMYNAARCYRNGTGTKRDIQSANYRFRKYKSLLITNKSSDHINPELKKILDDERFKLSWIDYNELRNIKEKGKGGFATVYSARWHDSINCTWSNVALKVIRDSNENEQVFIQELKNYCEIGYENPSFLNCEGVSRNDDGDYIIVMQIAANGSLRQNLVKVSQLKWKDKLNILN